MDPVGVQGIAPVVAPVVQQSAVQTEAPPAPVVRQKPVADPAKVAALLARVNPELASPAVAASLPPPQQKIDGSTTSQDNANGPAKNDSQDATAGAGDSKLAKRLAEVAKAEKRVRTRMAEIEANSAELAKFKEFGEAKTKGERIRALQSLFTEAELEDIYQGDLTDWILKKAAPSKEDHAKAEQERIRKAAKEALEEERKAGEEAVTKEMQTAQQGYVERAARHFESNAAKWPLIAQWGLPAGDILSHTEAIRKSQGRVPTADEVFDHFEKQITSKLEAAGYVRRTVEAPRTVEVSKPSPTVTSRWTSDSSQPQRRLEEMSLDEAKAAIKRKFLKS